MDTRYVDNILRSGRSIPGQSLTNDFEERKSFEKAPQITNLREGMEFIFGRLIGEETYPQILELVGAINYAAQGTRLNEFKKTKQIPDGALPPEIMEKIETLPDENSLMAQPEPSLLGR